MEIFYFIWEGGARGKAIVLTQKLQLTTEDSEKAIDNKRKKHLFSVHSLMNFFCFDKKINTSHEDTENV